MSIGGAAPRVWILRGAKVGDFAQMRALSHALEWPTEIRRLHFRPYELILHAWPRPTLTGVDRTRSDTLVPPWPDLLLTAGRRNELPARWIKRHAPDQIRLVHVGRPWSHPSHFDLVISNRQYGLEPGPNVIVNSLPLVDHGPQSSASGDWPTRFSGLSRPWTAVLIGGNSGPWVWTPRRAATFVDGLEALRARRGGSLLITTSARTPAVLNDAVQARLRASAYVHHYGSQGDNPYAALLALADLFVVTADSLSMLSEALATGREVLLYDHLHGRRGLDPTQLRWRPLVHRAALTLGPSRMRRDPQRLHDALRDEGAIGDLRSDAAPGRGGALHREDMARAVSAVQALFA